MENGSIPGACLGVVYQDGHYYDALNLPKGFVVKGDLDLSGMGLTELPDLSTVTVKGNFYCGCNQLTTLERAPKKVSGNVYCDDNHLVSLLDMPKCEKFCVDNKIRDVYGLDEYSNSANINYKDLINNSYYKNELSERKSNKSAKAKNGERMADKEKEKLLKKYRGFSAEIGYADKRLDKLGVVPFSGKYDGEGQDIFAKALQQAAKENNNVAVYINTGEVKGLFVVGPEAGVKDPEYCAMRFDYYKQNQERLRWDKPIDQQKIEEKDDSVRLKSMNSLASFRKKAFHAVDSVLRTDLEHASAPKWVKGLEGKLTR